MANFADKFGLPKDRFKLEEGAGNFEIIKIEFKESKKKYSTTEDGEKLVKKLVPIAYIDTRSTIGDKAEMKYFSMSKVIVQSCIDIVASEGHSKKIEDLIGKSFILKDKIFVAEVKKGTSEAGSKPYIFFV